MFDLITIAQMLYIALSLSVSACVRTKSRVLFVLPMYEELQPGQINLYTTFDWLTYNCGVFVLSACEETSE